MYFWLSVRLVDEIAVTRYTVVCVFRLVFPQQHRPYDSFLNVHPHCFFGKYCCSTSLSIAKCGPLEGLVEAASLLCASRGSRLQEDLLQHAVPTVSLSKRHDHNTTPMHRAACKCECRTGRESAYPTYFEGSHSNTLHMPLPRSSVEQSIVPKYTHRLIIEENINVTRIPTETSVCLLLQHVFFNVQLIASGQFSFVNLSADAVVSSLVPDRCVGWCVGWVGYIVITLVECWLAGLRCLI